MKLEIIRADYHDPRQASQLLALLSDYARDPMGGGKDLTDEVKAVLVQRLARVPGALSLLAYADGQPAGLLNAFPGFSTFAAAPLLNIHDLIVNRDYRGLGLSQRLLAEAEQHARAWGCCKLTLEVLAGNRVAQKAYARFGFAGYQLDPETGQALFWQKPLAVRDE